MSGRVAWLSFTATAIGLLGISVVQRSLMRLLLNYHGHMFLTRGKVPLHVKLWSGVLKVLGGTHPSLYNFQVSVPPPPFLILIPTDILTRGLDGTRAACPPCPCHR